MSRYVVEISDNSQKRLTVLVEFPIMGQDKWRVVDNPGLVFDSGVANIIDKTDYRKFGRTSEIIFHKHLNLYDSEKFFWTGVTLWDFQGQAEVNQSGKGIVHNSWFFKFDASCPVGSQIISWRIVE